MFPSSARLLGLLVVWFACSGATCSQFSHWTTLPAPRVLPHQASLADVTQLVNANTAAVQTLYVPDASLSAPLTPSLRATLAVAGPRRLRLRAETGLTGPELDLGSNDQQFWFWARRQQPPALFTCRHEQYATSTARQLIPIEPARLTEALGLTTFDPQLQHSGPFAIGGGRLRIQTALNEPNGAAAKVTIVDAARGWVVEQHWFDGLGNRLATSLTSNHYKDPASGVTLPRHIELQIPAAHFSADIDLRTLQINVAGTVPAQIFDLPYYPQTPVVDLADPQLRLGPTPTATAQPGTWLQR